MAHIGPAGNQNGWRRCSSRFAKIQDTAMFFAGDYSFPKGPQKNEIFGPKKDKLNGFGYLNPLYLGTRTLRAVQYSYHYPSRLPDSNLDPPATFCYYWVADKEPRLTYYNMGI